ncbi:uncharacterized protein LOC101888882 isoform X3 [Musca domestica]|uniref:Uncharacterized protein LOC101888882 isoform X2 n=1 Tax=Musca domestica TaxID=7370 RepID=A0A1I8MYW3_MUSDO|nr:uncharacterized protein LOC101888882 isoform X3 [Musca domestica]
MEFKSIPQGYPIQILKLYTMEELSEYSSPVIEFRATHGEEKHMKQVDKNTGTDTLPSKIDTSTEINPTSSKATQTYSNKEFQKNIDERKLAIWLRQILPSVEKELLKGCTPDFDSNAPAAVAIPEIQLYQKLQLDTTENSQGIGIWLAVHTNNAPILVISSVSPHDDDWCEHVDKHIFVYAPVREHGSNFITWREAKRISIKACLSSLCTNPFNKSIFAGSTMDGGIFIWNCHQSVKSLDITELSNATALHGYANAMDWSSEQTLLTAHSSGTVVQWRLGADLTSEAEYLIKASPGATREISISCLLARSANDFIVGCNDGSVYHCWISSSAAVRKFYVDIVPLKKHLFKVSSLLKTRFNGHGIVISCDLSGEVYFHDLGNSRDNADTVIAKIPLPFTNLLACIHDCDLVCAPGNDGSLDCYRLFDGVHVAIKGDLRGKGNFIKSSDNGCWIITGLYEKEFQIFSSEN